MIGLAPGVTMTWSGLNVDAPAGGYLGGDGLAQLGQTLGGAVVGIALAGGPPRRP